MLEKDVGFPAPNGLQIDENGLPDMQSGFETLQPVANANDVSAFTPAQRAAIILVSMGPQFAALITEKLDDDHMREFLAALEQLDNIPHESVLAVIADFVVLMNKSSGNFRGGPKRAVDIAGTILKQARLARIVSGKPLPQQPASETDFWNEVASRNSEEISTFLSAQSSEISAYILSNLPSDCAADTLLTLPSKTSAEIIKRLATKQEVAPFAQKTIKTLIREEFLDVGDDDADLAAIGRVADLLSLLSKTKRDELLADIEKTDKPRANKIRSSMIIFEDIPERLPVTAIQVVFKEYEKSDLVEVIKVGQKSDAATIEFFMKNISQRMAGQFREEAEELAEIEEAKADKIISKFMTFISQLERDGKITLIKPDLDV